MNFNTARLLANITARAARLWEDGYTLVRKSEDTVVVTSNEGTKYEVDLIFDSCECPCYKNQGTCKHLEGWERLEKIQAEYEEHLLAGAPTEDEEFGRTWYECRAAALAR
ncbi:hypothetical protein LBMAG21_10350 [Armatimonadota bacterium]|nr:hypothetical protein LBMAG21_10350 [Armatimonadota bacterium]